MLVPNKRSRRVLPIVHTLTSVAGRKSLVQVRQSLKWVVAFVAIVREYHGFKSCTKLRRLQVAKPQLGKSQEFEQIYVHEYNCREAFESSWMIMRLLLVSFCEKIFILKFSWLV